MQLTPLILLAITAYSLACMAYVYRWRGRTRYASFSQYLRKSWPIFAPLNCLMYMSTCPWARHPVLDPCYIRNIDLLREHWETIRDEALALEKSGAFDATKAPGSAGYYDVGFRTFYKRGWSKFYLKWYGTTHRSAQQTCPRTLALLADIPQIRGAIFSVLPPGAELTLHADPMACSFRYHLGLSTPNSRQCSIYVDGVPCTWHDGKDFVFDETYPHYARNDTDMPRYILMCDVDRPMHVMGRMVHAVYRTIAKSTVVPNTAEDRRGTLSALFCCFAPLRQRTLKLRETHRTAYKALKFTVNSTLLLASMGILWGAVSLLEAAIS